MQITKFKKITLIVGCIFVFILLITAIYTYSNRLYLPDLPMEEVTKKQAYQTIFNRYNDIRFLTDQGDYNWYIYNGSQKDGVSALTKRMNTLGYDFLEQMGSGYFFNKDNNQDKIVITSQQWTGKYVLFKTPHEVNF